MSDFLEAGLHRGIPMPRYVADPCPAPSVSKGVIHRIITQSPAHARYHHPRLNPNAPSDETPRGDLGSAIHAGILGGPEIVYAPAEFQDWRKKGAQEWRDQARQAGKIPLLDRQQRAVKAAVNAAVVTLNGISGWANKFETEGTILWQNKAGVWNRGRFDIWAEHLNLLVDVKTTESAEPGEWIRKTLTSSGYDIQAEHYKAGMRRLGLGDEDTEFYFLLVEIEPPYCASIVSLDPEFGELACRKIEVGTRRFAKCLLTNRWPGYTRRPCYAEPRPWESQAPQFSAIDDEDPAEESEATHAE